MLVRYNTLMRSRVPLFIFILLASSFSLPLLAHAGGIPFFGPIIPASSAQCAAGWGLLITVINNIISFFLTIAIVFVAPLMLAYAGFLFVVNPVNSGEIQKAKDVLTHTIVGIVIAFASWMIVGAVMAVLYHPSGSTWGAWTSLITGGKACIPLAGSLAQVTPTAPPPITTAPGVPGAADEASVRERLRAAGIGVNKAACSSVAGPACGGTPPSCTNVANMQDATIQQIINIATACGGVLNRCGVQVTGGTEPGHACGTYSHANGYKVDLTQNSATLNAYLQKFPLTGQRGGDSGGPIRIDTCGNQYVQEANHWDITVTKACGTSTSGSTAPSPAPGASVTNLSFDPAQGNRLMPTGTPGSVVAMRFDVVSSSSSGGVTLAETSTGGDTSTYSAWISSSPNGPALGNPPVIQHWRYTGGTIHFSGLTGPSYVLVKLTPGTYYFNVLNETGTAPFYAQLNISM
jgi:hypothetical protein